MQIKYVRSLWGMELPALAANLAMIKDGGFDGVEMGVPASVAQREELCHLLDKLDLALVVQQWTEGASPLEHLNSFEGQYRLGAEFKPLLINAHTGKDYFTTAENLVILQHAKNLEQERGVPVLHEIHRGRATFSATATMALLEAMPALKLTADFSHWCCVHESLLQDQAARVRRAIEHSYHIHARVGYEEGPQITDPRAPEWQAAVETHLQWWQQIVTHHQKLGTKILTICPEFGPPHYMMTQPYTRQPVTDLWEINCYMKDLLKKRLVV